MKKYLSLFLILVVCIESAAAFPISSYNVEIEVYGDGVAKVVNTLVFDSTKSGNSITIPAYGPESVIVYNDEGEVKFANIENNIIIQPNIQTKEYEIKIQYLTNKLTSKEGDDWVVKYNLPSRNVLKFDEAKDVRLIISVPNSAKLSYFTEGGVVYTQKNMFNVGWKTDLEEYAQKEFEIKYSQVAQTDGTSLVDILAIIFLAIIAAIVLGYCGYCAFKKITKRLSKGKKDIMKTLDKNEKAVITLLLENNHKMYQSKIQKDSAISKATLSRVLKRLEQKEILEITESGNTNLVKIKEWFLKK